MSRQNLKNLKPKAKNKKVSKKKGANNELTRKSKTKILLYTWLGVLSPLFIIVLMLVTTFESDLPSIEALENPRSDESTNIYDANGTKLRKIDCEGSYMKKRIVKKMCATHF